MKSTRLHNSAFWGGSVREPSVGSEILIASRSFFEWTHSESRTRAKFEFTIHDGGSFGMAGLWSPWLNPQTSQWEQTFSILTGEANDVMRPIRDRQPEILVPREYSEYLTSASRPPLHLSCILPGEEMKAEAVKVAKDEVQQRSLFGDSQ